jgi:DnaJ-class molecular chaperone
MRPSRRPTDPYTLLGVPIGATRAEIRRAYRRRALEIHPDVAGSDTTDAMADLNGARDQLLEHAATRRQPGMGDAASTSRTQSPDDPGYSHAPTWDDYWAAWNDPPRRRPG